MPNTASCRGKPHQLRLGSESLEPFFPTLGAVICVSTTSPTPLPGLARVDFVLKPCCQPWRQMCLLEWLVSMADDCCLGPRSGPGQDSPTIRPDVAQTQAKGEGGRKSSVTILSWAKLHAEGTSEISGGEIWGGRSPSFQERQAVQRRSLGALGGGGGRLAYSSQPHSLSPVPHTHLDLEHQF